MSNNLLKRKEIRIKEYDYCQEGMYFITICTRDRKCLLGKISEEDKIDLSKYGQVVEKYMKSINSIYENICINSYVIMPNHVHMICNIIYKNGSSRTPTPTNETIPFLISTLKRFTNKECKTKIWQRNYYEHIVRNEKEYIKILEYIKNNPLNWNADKYFK
ncbi:MAG: transposase [Clostridia bacterium]|nr:transposase [Clostridia bacterium]